MPSYKLEYFDGRGQGELIRYLFYVAEKDFEDPRYTFEQWQSLKSTTPFGHLPILHVDGLAGKDSWEQALVDQYMELAVDMFKEVIKWYFENDKEKKKELFKNLNEVVYPKFCGLFQNALEQNGGKYFVGSDIKKRLNPNIGIFNSGRSRNLGRV